jgi:hypothetical protein
VDLELNGKRVRQAKAQLIPVSSQVPPDPLFSSLLKHSYEDRATPIMEEVVAHAPFP